MLAVVVVVVVVVVVGEVVVVVVVVVEGAFDLRECVLSVGVNLLGVAAWLDSGASDELDTGTRAVTEEVGQMRGVNLTD